MRAESVNIQWIRPGRAILHGKEIILVLLLFSTCLPVFSQQPGTLMDAAFRGQNRLVETLVEQGSNVNLRDEDSLTPLIYAVLGGHTETVKILLSRGADCVLRAEDGAKPR